MRMKGTLTVGSEYLHETGGYPKRNLYGFDERHVARVVADETKADNAAHLAACWNAIEAVGGDPAIVAELVSVLKTTTDYLERAVDAIDIMALETNTPMQCQERIGVYVARAVLSKLHR